MRWVREAADAGVRNVLFTGGEPMLREQVVLRLMNECHRRGVSSRLATNGFWGKNPGDARKRLKALRLAGLVALNVSYDRYHAEFQGPEPALNIARAAAELDFTINITVTRLADDSELGKVVEPFRELPNVRLRFYDVQPVGFAKDLPRSSLRSEVDGFCSACSIPAITDDGRMTACNGPAYFSNAASPLSIGTLAESSMEDLVKLHRCDPILETIRTSGPAGLREELKSIKGFEDFPWKDQYYGMCELCLQITSNPQAVEALRKRLSAPEAAAKQLAVRQVMEANKRSAGMLNTRFVNGVGASRTFFRAATAEHRWTEESKKILGRADLDWGHQVEYLMLCGLARPLLPALDDDALLRWAPIFFTERLRQRAVQEEMLELTQREVLRRISTILRATCTRGVLLKGAARLLIDLQRGNHNGARPPGDIDIYVDPSDAETVQRRLMESGFKASKPNMPNHHHLARLRCRGIAVEIHTQIMSSSCGLPEQQMLSSMRSIECKDFDNLYRLDAEAMLLHTCVHATNHFFPRGLRTAWDVHWILNHFPDIDWDRVVALAKKSKISRAFWVPARLLAEELDIPIPSDVLKLAPNDANQRKLERIARAKFFDTRDKRISIIETAFSLLLNDSVARRIRISADFTASWIRSQRRPGGPSPRRIYKSLRQALVRWRGLRR